MFRTGPLSDSAIEAVCLSGRPLPIEFAQQLLEPLYFKGKRLTAKPLKTRRGLARPARMSYLAQSMSKISDKSQMDWIKSYVDTIRQMGAVQIQEEEIEFEDELNREVESAAEAEEAAEAYADAVGDFEEGDYGEAPFTPFSTTSISDAGSADSPPYRPFAPPTTPGPSDYAAEAMRDLE